jgi:hypothetical protein
VVARVVVDGCCKNLRMRERWGGGGQPRKRGGGGCNQRGLGGGAARATGGTSRPDRDPRPNSLSRLLRVNSTVLLVNAS